MFQTTRPSDSTHSSPPPQRAPEQLRRAITLGQRIAPAGFGRATIGICQGDQSEGNAELVDEQISKETSQPVDSALVALRRFDEFGKRPCEAIEEFADRALGMAGEQVQGEDCGVLDEFQMSRGVFVFIVTFSRYCSACRKIVVTPPSTWTPSVVSSLLAFVSFV